jgi:hypothetical protein
MTLTPGELCRGLLHALDASEGRRKRRARNTTADRIGFAVQRELLEGAVRDDPPPDEFEAWLLARCAAEGLGDGPVRAIALSIWDQWQLAQRAPDVRAWILAGAESDDRERGGTV